MEPLKDVGLEVYKDLDFYPSLEDFNFLREIAKDRFCDMTHHEITLKFSKYTYKEWYKILNNIEVDIIKINKRQTASLGCRRITYRVLSESILNKLPLNEYESIGGDIKTLIKHLNECYQFRAKCFAKTNKGDYSQLIEIIDKYIYLKKIID